MRSRAKMGRIQLDRLPDHAPQPFGAKHWPAISLTALDNRFDAVLAIVMKGRDIG